MDLADIEIGLLGPLEVRVGGAPVDVGPLMNQRLLAMLATRVGRPVSRDVLIDVLWRDDIPADPAASLNSYVSRLRRALGTVREAIETSRGGYRLDIDKEAVDGFRLEELVRRSRAALADGDLAEASALLRDATLLNRGRPLAQFDHPELTAIAHHWDDVISQSIELRGITEIRLGRGYAVLPELRSVVRVRPHDEAVWRALLRTRHVIGGADAVGQTATEMTRVLQGDLGVDPSPQTLQLIADLTADGPADSLLPPSPVRPHRIPLPPVLMASLAGPFVGRRHSLTELTGADGAPVLLVGEPGIGKSRLAAEAAERLATSGYRVAAARCWPGEDADFEVVRRLVESLLAAVTPDRLDDLGVAGSDLVRLVEGRPLIGRGELPTTEAHIDRITRRAVRSVVEQLADDEGLLLVVDDVQWADQTSLDLLIDLVREPPPQLRVIYTARDDESVPAQFRTMVTERRLKGLRLRPLDESGIAALARATTGDRVSRESIERLHRASGGNPYFAVELIGAGWIDGGLDPPMPPASLAELIRARMATLPMDARHAVEYVAVAGGSIEYETLAACGVEGGLDWAVTSGLLSWVDDGTVTFVHMITQAAVEAGIDPNRRRSIHRGIGEAMMTSDLDELGLMRAARHLRDGGAKVDSRWLAAVRQSARLALDRGAYSAAIRRFCEVAAQVTSVDEGGDVLVELAAAERLAGDRLAARETAMRYLVLPGADRNAIAFADAALLSAPRRPDASVAPTLRAAMARLADRDPSRRAALLVELGWALAEAEPERAFELVEEGDVLAGEYQNFDASWRALDFEWEWQGYSSSVDLRLERASDLADRASSAGDRIAAAHGHLHRVICHLEKGYRTDLSADADRVAAIVAEIRTPVLMARVAQCRAMWAHLTGDLDGAEAAANDVFALVPGDPSFVPVYAGQLIAIRKEQRALDGMVELIEADEDNRDHPLALAAKAMIHAHLGDHASARSILAGFDDRALRALPPDMSRLTTLVTLAEASALSGCSRSAERLEPELSDHADRIVVFGYGAVCNGSVRRFLGPLAALRGGFDEAIGHHLAAAAAHRRLGATTHLARDQLELARLLRTRDPAGAAERLGKALELADRYSLVDVSHQANEVDL